MYFTKEFTVVGITREDCLVYLADKFNILNNSLAKPLMVIDIEKTWSVNCDVCLTAIVTFFCEDFTTEDEVISFLEGLDNNCKEDDFEDDFDEDYGCEGDYGYEDFIY